MSKPVKNLMTESYRRRFDGVDGLVVVDIRGIDANTNNALRSELAKQQIRITVVKNSLAAEALSDSPVASVEQLLTGPCAFAYGLEGLSVVNVARQVLDQVKKVDNLEVKGAVLEGEVFSAGEVDRLSKFPTREEQLAKCLQIILSPGQKLAGAVESPGAELTGAIKGAAGQVAGLLAVIKDKLEKGESISRVA
jgi:large subunit ribosomal protein L10